MRPVTLITGASSGIGADWCGFSPSTGHELALVARREHRLVELADEIAAADCRERRSRAVRRCFAPCRRAHRARSRAGNVVNNAGFGWSGRRCGLIATSSSPCSIFNVRALTELSLAFIDSLARHRGGILNVASVAAFLPGPGMAVYYASKAYVLSFTEALHHELARLGVRVTALCPDRWRPGSKCAPGCEKKI
jgi:short-subunit dehydrogenase